MTASYALLTPYLEPPSQAGSRLANLSDGFVQRAIERLLKPSAPIGRYSPRAPPPPVAQAVMAQARHVVLAGADQLDDRYSVWPGMTAEQLRQGAWRFVFFGVGLNRDPDRSRRMSDGTREILEAIHQRTEYSSWRCPATVRYLRAELPHLADRFLMTGCPVLMDQPLLDGQRFDGGERSIAVTATERGDFWAREAAIIDRVARRFPRARRYFVVHQDCRPRSVIERCSDRLHGRSGAADPARALALRRYAASRGYQVLVPDSADVAAAIYDAIDLHVGSRLHAHLLFLSRNKKSWLVPADGRARGMAEAFPFPLVTASVPEPDWNFDFEPLRQQVQRVHGDMQRFLTSWARR
ncbi:MAG: hypothetical protein JWQ90_1922 [Hydrocarboniphaga sp.]|uniref:hypothetical protein n=1 Tax=Hydrocarboniphaga sp. TaxID=2033016 RepID=UPI002635F814|nr:hypothetical protein [Hydrocarboniphaga sp.]MDB5969472.1 hypothetical protein [Hydrocarboniphaga sp.]